MKNSNATAATSNNNNNNIIQQWQQQTAQQQRSTSSNINKANEISLSLTKPQTTMNTPIHHMKLGSTLFSYSSTTWSWIGAHSYSKRCIISLCYVCVCVLKVSSGTCTLRLCICHRIGNEINRKRNIWKICWMERENYKRKNKEWMAQRWEKKKHTHKPKKKTIKPFNFELK